MVSLPKPSSRDKSKSQKKNKKLLNKRNANFFSPLIKLHCKTLYSPLHVSVEQTCRLPRKKTKRRRGEVCGVKMRCCM